jgi:DNA-binding response OmpR family regulator
VGDRVLVVEDDTNIGRGIAQALRGDGYDVEVVTTGAEAMMQVGVQPPSLVVLDLGLPDVDGIALCGAFRNRMPDVPIVILTARAQEIDVVVGLDAGADDYVTKPFRLAELLARVRAHLRRPRLGDTPTPLCVGDLVIDGEARRVTVAGDEIELRPKEFELLVLLAANAGRAVPREEIMSSVWDEHWFGSTKTLDMHISALRRKIDRDRRPSRITTLRGVGYRLELP